MIRPGPHQVNTEENTMPLNEFKPDFGDIRTIDRDIGGGTTDIIEEKTI